MDFSLLFNIVIGVLALLRCALFAVFYGTFSEGEYVHPIYRQALFASGRRRGTVAHRSPGHTGGLRRSWAAGIIIMLAWDADGNVRGGHGEDEHPLRCGARPAPLFRSSHI